MGQTERSTSVGTLWRWWKAFAKKAANVQARVFLTLFYFLIVAPVGAAVRIASDPLHVRHRSATPVWQHRDAATPTVTESRHPY